MGTRERPAECGGFATLATASAHWWGTTTEHVLILPCHEDFWQKHRQRLNFPGLLYFGVQHLCDQCPGIVGLLSRNQASSLRPADG